MDLAPSTPVRREAARTRRTRDCWEPADDVDSHASSRRDAGGPPGRRRAFNVWMTAVDSPFQKAVDEFRHSDGIVIDLRGNPGGLAAMLMGISATSSMNASPWV